MYTEEELIALVRPLPQAKYECDHMLNGLERALASYESDYGLDLVPDFQRGHVWTQEQQERYIEAILRGALSSSSLVLQFNTPRIDAFAQNTGDLSGVMVCVDGLQRLTALRSFIAGDIRAFGLTATDLQGTKFDPRRFRIRFAIHAFAFRAELLQYYLDLNAGGTPHSAEEIARVREMQREAAAADPPAAVHATVKV